jgi:hypothetical protein
MPKRPPTRRPPILGALLPLPLIVAVLTWYGWLGGAATNVAANVGVAGNLSFGAVDATAEYVSAPPANQMMMPMHSGAGHDDEIQVAIQVRNDTDRPVTVPFGRVRLLPPGGTEVAAVAGLLGDLRIRPHAAVEERLRFPAVDAAQVQLRIPDGDRSRTLTVPVRRSGPAAPSGSPTHAHNGNHG